MRVCEDCGGSIESAAKFCPHCAHPVETTPPAQETTPPTQEAGSTLMASSASTSPVPTPISSPSSLSIAPPPGAVAPASPAMSQYPYPAVNRKDRFPRRRDVLWFVGIILLAAALGVFIANDVAEHHDVSQRTAALSSMTTQRDTTQSHLNQTQSQLQQSQQSLTQSQSSLKQAQSEIDGLNGSLSTANSQLNLQSGQIATLKTCLTGVLQSIVYAGENDLTDALNTINAVQLPCQEGSAIVNPQ